MHHCRRALQYAHYPVRTALLGRCEKADGVEQVVIVGGR